MDNNTNGKKKITKQQKRKRKIVIFVIEIIILLIILLGLFIFLKLSKLDTGNELDEKNVQTNELPKVTKQKLKGYTTVALFGLDNRSNGDYKEGNSDVIIIASINNDTKEVKMASVYRDTLLNLTDDDGYHKANAAYAYGGVDQAVSMLNVNLDLDIKDYVTVDFNAIVKAVDLLGGVEIEITDEEERLMRGYMDEVSGMTGVDSDYLGCGGLYNLDGVQATSYARVRYTAGDDFKRTERQRLVIEKMVEKALKSDIGTINGLIDEVFPEIETSFSITELLSLAKDAFEYQLGENTGFPFEQKPMILKSAGDCIVPADLASNVEELHHFLFADEDYQVTSSVQTISDEIVYRSGVSASGVQEQN